MAKKKTVKRAVRKPAAKLGLISKPRVTKKKTRKAKAKAVNLPQPTFVSAFWGGQTPDGRSAVHISVDPEAHIDRLVVTVNGKGVWEGQP